MLRLVLPSMLLGASAGLALGFHDPHRRHRAIIAASLLLPIGLLGIELSQERLALALWATAVLWGFASLANGRLPFALTLLLAASTGGLIGLPASGAAAAAGLAGFAFAASLSRFAVERRCALAVKMIAAWLIAASLLNGSLPLLPVTPGYLPDHLE